MKISNRIREQRRSASSAMPTAKQPLSPVTTCIAAAMLAAAVFAVYSPALNYQFILDDHRFLADPRLQFSGHVWEYFTSYVWAQTVGGPPCFYRPLFVLWLRLNFVLNGASPWGWHLLSIAKHVSVAVLLGVLVWKLLRDRAAALMAGTLFALHPAQTESVAWVTVPDPLMSAAVLGTVLLYLAYAERVSAEGEPNAENHRKKSRKEIRSKSTGSSPVAWMIASSAACLAALMAKETALVLPVVLFVITSMVPIRKADEAKSEEDEGFRNRLVSAFRETVPFLGVTVVYLLLRINALNGHFSPLTQHLPWRTLLLSWPAILWFYVKVIVWPVRPQAFADPILANEFSARGVLLPGLEVCCAAVLLAGVCVWARRKARHDLPEREATGVKRALALGVLLLVLPILLTLNLNVLNPGDFLHGRYTYLPLAGLMLLLATGWHLAGRSLTKKSLIAMISAAGLIAVTSAVLTVWQESGWTDDLTVFTTAHRCAPHNQPVALNLARAKVQVALGLDEAGRCDEAMPMFEQAIQQYPQDWFAWAGRGECLVKLNDLPGAEQSLRRASELSHEPRVAEEWRQVRAMMGLNTEPPK